MRPVQPCPHRRRPTEPRSTPGPPASLATPSSATLVVLAGPPSGSGLARDAGADGWAAAVGAAVRAAGHVNPGPGRRPSAAALATAEAADPSPATPSAVAVGRPGPRRAGDIASCGARRGRGDREAARGHRGHGVHRRRQRLRDGSAQGIRELLRPDVGPAGADPAGGRQPRLAHDGREGLPGLLRRGGGERRRQDVVFVRPRDVAHRRPRRELLEGRRLRRGLGAGQVADRGPRRASHDVHARRSGTSPASAPATSTATTPRSTRSGAPSTRPAPTSSSTATTTTTSVSAQDPTPRPIPSAGSASSSSAPVAPRCAASPPEGEQRARGDRARRHQVHARIPTRTTGRGIGDQPAVTDSGGAPCH